MKPNASAREQTKNHRSSDWLILAGLVLPVLVYLPALIGGVPFPSSTSQFSDLMITHYPYLLYLKRSLGIYHQIPLWYSTIYAGAPLAANPLAGLFYIPGWVAMLFPLPMGILLVAAGHSVFGAGGMYLLLRRLEVEKRSSLFGAVCFGMMPKMAAHLGAGHISLLYALAWTPWLLAVSLKDRRGWRTGVVAGMLFLADPRWAVYAGLLYVFFAVAHRHIGADRNILFYLRASLIAFLIAAPLILPLIEYIPLSTRSALSTADVFRYGLPASQLLGLILPVSGGNIEWYLYAGGGVIAFAVLQYFQPQLWRRSRFWNLTILVCLLLSLAIWGNNYSWVVKIPILAWLRVPARALFLVGFCLAVVSGLTLDFLQKSDGSEKIFHRVGIGILAFAILFGAGIQCTTGRINTQVIWGSVSLGLAAVILMFHSRLNSTAFYGAFGLLLVVDLVGAGWMTYQVRTDYTRAEPEVLSYLEHDQDVFRIYSPSYSVGQEEAVENSLEMVNGVDPLQISSYASFMERAAGVTDAGYSVSIPGFTTGDPDTDNAGSVPDAELLGLLNVKYLISEFPIEGEGFERIELESEQYLYRNQQFYPRAWVEDREGSGGIRAAFLIKYQPNQFEIQAEGPGYLILSETYYPGWNVLIDGQITESSPAYEVLRQVAIPEGSHVLEFVYRPLSVYAGLALAGIGWLIAILMITRKEF